MDCWLETGVIRGMSNFTPSSWTNKDLAEDSLSRAESELIAVGTLRVGWDGFFSCKCRKTRIAESLRETFYREISHWYIHQFIYIVLDSTKTLNWNGSTWHQTFFRLSFKIFKYRYPSSSLDHCEVSFYNVNSSYKNGRLLTPLADYITKRWCSITQYQKSRSYLSYRTT